MALMLNLKEQSFNIGANLEGEKEKFEFLNFRYSEIASFSSKNSPDLISLKKDLDILKSNISKNEKKIGLFEKEINSILSKCTEVTLEKIQSIKNRKSCTAKEKTAIRSVISNFNFIQGNKRNWDEKKRVAESFYNDFTKPEQIRNTARLDIQKYSNYYQIEQARESFIEEQFAFLNASCLNSGLYLPKAYQPPAAPPVVDPVTSIFLEDHRFIFNTSIGGLSIERNADESYKVVCNESNFTPKRQYSFSEGLSLKDARLLILGSRAKDDLYTIFTLDVYRAKEFLVPVEKFKLVGTKIYRQSDYDLFGTNYLIGKPISFSSNGSLCGLVTEPIINPKLTLAKDITTIGLALIIKTSNTANRVWASEQLAIILGSFEVK